MDSFLNNLDAELLAMGLVIAALISVMAAFLGVSIAANRSRQRRMDRLDRVRARTSKTVIAEAGPSAFRDKKENNIEKLMLRYLPNPDKLRSRLEQTGRDIRPGIYVMIMGIWALVEAFLLWILLDSPVFIALISGIAGGIFIPHIVISIMIGKRRNAFLNNFPEAIDIMVRGLKAGLPVTESIGAVGRESVEPVGGVFREVADKIRVGENLEDAITTISSKMNVSEFKFLAITLSIQKETGGNLAETLGNLSDILRKRRFMKLKVRAVSSEARASALILGSLPLLMFLLLFMVSTGYVMTLITNPTGHLMLAAGLFLMGLGGAIMAKMVRFEI